MLATIWKRSRICSASEQWWRISLKWRARHLKLNGEELIMRRKVPGTCFCGCPGGSYLAIILGFKSERVEPRQQVCLAFPAWRFGGSGGPIHLFQSLAFGFNIGSCVDIGRVEAFMSKPATDHCHVHLCRDKAHGGGVPEPVWGDSFAKQGGDLLARGCRVLLQLEADAGGFEWISVPVHEDGFIFPARPSFQERFQ